VGCGSSNLEDAISSGGGGMSNMNVRDSFDGNRGRRLAALS